MKRIKSCVQGENKGLGYAKSIIIYPNQEYLCILYIYIYTCGKFPTVRIFFTDIYVYGFILTARGLFFIVVSPQLEYCILYNIYIYIYIYIYYI